MFGFLVCTVYLYVVDITILEIKLEILGLEISRYYYFVLTF